MLNICLDDVRNVSGPQRSRAKRNSRPALEPAAGLLRQREPRVALPAQQHVCAAPISRPSGRGWPPGPPTLPTLRPRGRPAQYLAEVDPGRQRLLEDIKANTMRYIGIAAEAADEAMPPPEGLPQADIFDRLLETVSARVCGARGGQLCGTLTSHRAAEASVRPPLPCPQTRPPTPPLLCTLPPTACHAARGAHGARAGPGCAGGDGGHGAQAAGVQKRPA